MNRLFGLVIGFLFALGFIAGYELSSISGLRTYKLLNLAGLFYTFLGVLVLSELLATARWKAFCVRWIAPMIFWPHMIIPVGSLIGSGAVGQMMSKPSADIVTRFSIFFWVLSLIALTPFIETVLSPRLSFIKTDVETRWRWLGFFLVVCGVGAQFIAAVMDLAKP